MTQEIHIRKAIESDAAAIKEVINSAFRIAEHFFVDGDRVDLAEVQEGIRKGAFLLVESNHVIDGCVYVEPRGDKAYLGLLSVNPHQQQRGTGSRLVQAAENYCRNLGCGFMEIKIVNVRTELPAFYSKRGYVETGTSPFPPGIETKVPCHFIDMTKRL
jgi:N-acetylglutamate synthase-like GNAT family acetyltransferase